MPVAESESLFLMFCPAVSLGLGGFTVVCPELVGTSLLLGCFLPLAVGTRTETTTTYGDCLHLVNNSRATNVDLDPLAGALTLWIEASKTLRGMLSHDLYERWFAPIKPVAFENDLMVLGVANDFYMIWLQDNFLPLVRETVSKTAQRPIQVKFAVSASVREIPAPKSPPAGRSEVVGAPAAKPATSLVGDLKLNPRYVFDSFVVGPNNNFSHAAALAVAQSPGKAYNPLFLYGGVGLGKTHLMQAIGHFVASSSRNAKVCYITSEQLTNEFIQALQTSSLTKFRKKFRSIDVLLIDDIQFLAGKTQTQEEFFHTFNSLFDAHKQIVLSSDRPAAEIANLENRLVSRFEWGLVTDIQPPALETRIAILKKKAASMSVSIPDDVLEFVAERIRTNIRRLESALTRIAGHASLTGSPISIPFVESLLRDSLHEESKRALSFDSIQRTVAEHFDLRLADMTSRRRPQNIAFPRQMAMYLCRRLTDRSLMDIGEAFGGRDHGTVLHACKLVEEKLKTDEKLRFAMAHLEQVLLR
jgi:chromosomal replication initiator protein